MPAIYLFNILLAMLIEEHYWLYNAARTLLDMSVYSHNKLIDAYRCDMAFVLKITLTVIIIK